MEPFDTLLEGSAGQHGHLCPGQVVGVRMAMLGCRLIGLDNPKSREQIKKLLVFIEMDRCTADAVAYVTGVKLGRRSLKFMDYGIMAASFVNLSNRKSFRIISTEESRDLCDIYAPEVEGKHQKQLCAYKRMPDSVLFKVQKVSIDIPEVDLPGPTIQKTMCCKCGQMVRDGREVKKDGQALCRPCWGNCYFSDAREIFWPRMDQSSLNGKNSSRPQGFKNIYLPDNHRLM